MLQPAVSRRVADLEQALGVRLMHRTRPGVTLTPEGEVLFHAIAGSLMQVQTAVEQIRLPAERNTLVVDSTIGFASCYLMQRLPAFRSAHPDIVIELVSRDLSDDYHQGGSDVIIVFDEPARLPGLHKSLIFGEELVPLCAPAYLPGPVPAERLCDHRLLHLVHGNHTRDWERYAASAGLRIAPPGSAERFTSFTVCLQAALNGDGIMLGWEHLLQDHLNAGRLIRACDQRLKTRRGYFACITGRAAENRHARAFVDWLAGEGQQAAMIR
ncbi:LysR family transcriptional regulator [Ruegeria sediminis]|uniref:LysR family transcriptional regulator n=1 Tax=Ruegeria sediminis TaxID=2583820 RepID=A0ABY2WSI1_9RHOB|nr:LysR family transcriptional regulator [Ruegeria sediminis]